MTTNYNQLASFLLGQNSLVTPASAEPPNALYRIRRGDTLGRIANDFGVSVSDIAKWNNIKNPNKIREGATIVVRPVPLAPPPPVKAGGPVVDKFVGRGEQPYPYSPNPIGIDLPQADPIPLGLGGNTRAAGLQTIMTEMPGASPQFNPTTKREGPAAALTRQRQWTPGDEGGRRPQVEIPVEIVSEPRDPKAIGTPVHDPSFTPTALPGERSLWDQMARELYFLGGALGPVGSVPGTAVRGGLGMMFPKTVRMVDAPAVNINKLAPHGLARNTKGQFVRPAGVKADPKMGTPKRPPVTVDPVTGKFKAGQWPAGQNPNLRNPVGYKDDPTFGDISLVRDPLLWSRMK